MIVTLSDGQELDFPDEASPDQMRKYIAKNYPDESKKQTVGQKAFQYGVQDPLAGLAKFGESVGNIPNSIEESLFSGPARVFGKINLGSKAIDVPEDKKNLVDKLIQFAPELAGSVLVPETKLGSLGELIKSIPKIGKYLQPAAGKSVSQGLLAASQSPERRGESGLEATGINLPFATASQMVLGGSPTMRLLGRLGLGAGGGFLGYELGKGMHAPDIASSLMGAAGFGLGYRGFPARRAQEKVLEGVEKYPYKESIEAAERLGLPYITPSEATGSPYLGKIEGRLGTTPEGAQKLLEKSEERASAETKSIQNLMQTIFDPKDKEKIGELYESAFSKNVPKDKLKELENNEIFKAAVKNMNKSPAYQEDLKGVPKNSIKYLDYVKEALYDMAEGAGSKEAKRIDSMRHKVVNMADSIAPDYKAARALYERQATRKDIQDVFDKKRMEGLPMSKFLQSESGFEELQQHLRNVPEAQAQLKDMKLIFQKLIPTPTARAAAALSRTSMSEPRSAAQYLKESLENKLSSDQYDKAAVELITNPKWYEELEKLKKISKQEELTAEFMNLLGKASSQSIAQ